jgi:hypothetical protein
VKPSRPLLDKPRPLDYLFMIGGPVFFLAICWWGLRAIAGGGGAESPIQRLRDGAVQPGMTQMEVIKSMGPPKADLENQNGSHTFRYMHGNWDTQRNTFLEEDGYVDFGPDGKVSGITFEARTPDPPK